MNLRVLNVAKGQTNLGRPVNHFQKGGRRIFFWGYKRNNYTTLRVWMEWFPCNLWACSRKLVGLRLWNELSLMLAVFNSLICCSNRVETCFKISLTFCHTFWDSSGELKSLSLLIVQADGNQFFEGLYMYLWYAFRTQSSKYFFSRIADS